MGRCRFCEAPLSHTLIDLGMHPLCKSYLTADQLNQMEPFYPLHEYVCEAVLLVQLQEYVRPDHILSEYAYFSSHDLLASACQGLHREDGQAIRPR